MNSVSTGSDEMYFLKLFKPLNPVALETWLKKWKKHDLEGLLKPGE